MGQFCFMPIFFCQLLIFIQMKTTFIVFIFLAGCPLLLFGQRDTVLSPIDPVREIIEDFLQNAEGDIEFDYNTLFEDLETYLDRPINLNEATEEELKDLIFLDDVQIVNLLRYRNEQGNLIALQELQVIPGFDLATIRRILPFVTLRSSIDDYQLSIPQMLREGKNEFFLRWSRILEEQRGYQPLPEGSTGSRYLGDPNKLYFRYRHSYSNKLSYGITAEKDRGEEFFTGSNTQGFDFYSAHLYLRNYNRRIKALALGDYAISMGQGLILFSGFGAGKSSSPMSIKRTARPVRAYSSVNEADFLRGAAANLTFGELDLTAFVSTKKVDGNLVIPDTIEFDDGIIREFTSLRIDGLHRTPNEIQDENVISQFTTGGIIKYKKQNWHIAGNLLYNQLNKSLQTTLRPYNQFYFRGDQLLNASLDYSLIWSNFNFFGETAISDNGAIATVNGLLIGLDRKADLSLLFRHYPKDYWALNANPFAETAGARNETGIYLGLEVRPLKNWILNGYFDSWRHPWIRFNADAPYTGYEYRARITHFKKRTYRIYLEIREERKFINAPENETKFNFIIPTTLLQTRLHISNQLTNALELRSRVDFGYFENEVEGRQKGFLILQDIIFKPIDFPLHFTTRYAIFDTHSYDIRFYHYENNLLYNFSIPPYYNKGTRFYLNLRYRGIRNVVLECRYAQTYWKNRDNFGSGLEQIEGPARSEVAAQIKYQF